MRSRCLHRCRCGWKAAAVLGSPAPRDLLTCLFVVGPERDHEPVPLIANIGALQPPSHAPRNPPHPQVNLPSGSVVGVLARSRSCDVATVRLLTNSTKSLRLDRWK